MWLIISVKTLNWRV